MGVFRIELEDDFVRYFSERYEIRQATDFIQENLTGAYAIEYSLASGEPEGISAPEYLTSVEQFGHWFRKQPKVDHVHSVADTVKYINKKMHGDDERYSKIPHDRSLIAQYLLLYELSLPSGMDLNHRINLDRSATRMTVVLNDMTTRELLTLDQEAQQWLKANAPERMFTHGTGVSMIWAHLTRRNIRSMLGASLAVLTLISVMLIFAIRSFFLGLLSLIPNLMPILMALGLWGLTVGRIGLAASVIMSLTIGIVVDDSIHFLCTYRRARRVYRMNSPDAVRFCFRTVGSAMSVTSVVLVVGFLMLCFSGYRVSAEMGLLTAVTVVFALVMDFLLLPTLLMKVDHGHVGSRNHLKSN
jgi:predicted RND superfamily exporter protein